MMIIPTASFFAIVALLTATGPVPSWGWVPLWTATYNMSRSVATMPCNQSGFTDPLQGLGPWGAGIVDFGACWCACVCVCVCVCVVVVVIVVLVVVLLLMLCWWW